MSVTDFLSHNSLARRALAIFLAVIFLVAAAAGIYIHIHYSDVMPHSPQPQTGRVYRMVVNHGTVIYVNKQELDRADTLKGFLSCSLLAPLSSGFSPLQSSDEPARVEVLVERVERQSRDQVHFWLKVTNRLDRPVFLAGTNFESRPIPELAFLEQWRPKQGWKLVAPCMDTPPPHVIKLNPGGAMTLDLVLELPLSAVCKERNIQLEGRFRYRLEYFDSEKQARTYVKKIFSPRWREARARVTLSEPFEIPPTPSPER